jgi:TPR repeat protein
VKLGNGSRKPQRSQRQQLSRTTHYAQVIHRQIDPAGSGFFEELFRLGWVFRNSQSLLKKGAKIVRGDHAAKRIGQLVPKDLAEARRWYEMAAAAGDETAKELLIKLSGSGTRN